MSKRKQTQSEPASQTRISAFFPSPSQTQSLGPRSSSPIDLTLDSESDTGTPSRKRLKITSGFFSPSPTKKLGKPSAHQLGFSKTTHAGTAERYRFDPSLSSRGANVEYDNTQRKRRERAKKILLGNRNVFTRHVGESGGPSPFDDDGEGEPSHELEAHIEGDSGEDDDAKFMETISFFTNPKAKGKGKAKGSTAISKSRKVREIGPSGEPYTPLELQILELKRKHPGTVLMFEVGYKYRFYGDDAPIAARELGIVAFQYRNFLAASIPVHRRDVHLRKLLSQGYKVGIIGQTETAALKKVGDNRNELFSRDLTNLYTAATYVDHLGSADDMDAASVAPLICLAEELRGGLGTDEKVTIGMVAVSPSTGDVVWDHFDDNHMRTELETRMVHTTPSEVLLPEDKLSKPTEKMLSYFTAHSTAEHKTRTERYDNDLTYTEAFSYLTKFYTEKSKDTAASETIKSGKLMAAVSDFPKSVVIALAHVVRYLSKFEVAGVLLETNFYSKFTERTHMLLNGNTLTNLEIYRNETDFKKNGSLMWILDHTTSKFGARMLRDWVGRPLTDASILKERTDAIEEILATSSAKLTTLRTLLKNSPDLARGLCRIQYGKCTPQELATLLPAFHKIAVAFNSNDNPGFKSPVLNGIISALPKLREPMQVLLSEINLAMARDGNKVEMWRDLEKYPDLDSLTVNLEVRESELIEELKNARKVLKKPALQYITWNGEEYVIEVKKNENRDIPTNWLLVSSTKTVRRWRTPKMRELVDQRAQLQEALAIESNRVYQSFLQQIASRHYAILRDAVNKLSVADCLLSLALVALQPGYVRPTFSEDGNLLEMVNGRHPMVEALRDEPFVPNTVRMGAKEPRSKIITGPNMGGKSSTVRMVALCAIMAQIGSYVPAASMRMSMVDGILIRMGASDELARGRSTFMVEMQETSEILQLATKKSLVILDELGRGTSTFDGMAVASAVLQHLIQITRCKTLFITHYPQVATDLEKKFPSEVENRHMGFAEDTRIDGTREVTFLYKLMRGLAVDSFGVECARLAGVPEGILQNASSKALTMKDQVERRISRNKLRKCIRVLNGLPDQSPSTKLQELKAMLI